MSEEKPIEIVDYVVCPVCSAQKKELGFHMSKLHDIDKLEFNKRWPGYPMMCDVSKRKKGASISKSYIGKPKRELTVTELQRKSISEKSKIAHQKKKRRRSRSI